VLATVSPYGFSPQDFDAQPMKVFLSSTAVDLEAHRRVADDTILRLSQQAVVMERFGPLHGEPVAECERKAREADVLICLVAHRYGFEPEADKGSITRREVEAARAAGKKVLVWIVADDHPWSEKKEQDRLTDPSVLSNPERVVEVARSVQALQEFKGWLRTCYVCDTFTTPNDLGRKIAVALSTYARERGPDAVSPAVPACGEVRIVHALQPAPHFHGREALLEELRAWAADLASADRVWSLVAPGGSGKTAVAERLVATMEPGAANVLVWSFYERPDADAFLRECNQLFLSEEEGPAGGRLERLERGLRDGRPHLIVLDGLERVQEEAGSGRVRGELSDHTLKLLLRAIANGLGRTRAIVTSRFPLVDLENWSRRGYRDTRLDDLSPDAAVAVLRGWGVVGSEAALTAAADQVGRHALSVAVIGSYLRSFADGRIEAVADFDLDAVTSDDLRAAKLARVLAFYAQRLPDEERELLARLAVFPRGVSLELLGSLVEAGGDVAGLLVNARSRLLALLNRLEQRGLVFRYPTPKAETWSAHPFLLDRFRQLLGCPEEQVFAVVADALGANLEKRPTTKPSEPAELDRFERLIEATRLAGQEDEAFQLYWYGLGGYKHLATALGEYERGYRILTGFQPSLQPVHGEPPLLHWGQVELINELALFADKLGRLDEARALRELHAAWKTCIPNPPKWTICLVNISQLAFTMGHLGEAYRFADQAIKEYEAGVPVTSKKIALIPLAHRATVAHAQGDFESSEANFTAATQLEGETLYSLRGAKQARHCLDLGDHDDARALIAHGMEIATQSNWKDEIPLFHALLARLALAEGSDPTTHLEVIRAWTSRSGDMELIITAHLLAARHYLATGDSQSAWAEAELGVLHAETCGYGLLRIELLIAQARIRLVWPDPPASIQAARHALDLATAPECGYAWGEADAVQAWGEAYYATGELELAQRAFRSALTVRQRIRHPKVAETVQWLARIP
jgi:tetratricopeptide (TPR) repeat protein